MTPPPEVEALPGYEQDPAFFLQGPAARPGQDARAPALRRPTGGSASRSGVRLPGVAASPYGVLSARYPPPRDSCQRRRIVARRRRRSGGGGGATVEYLQSSAPDPLHRPWQGGLRRRGVHRDGRRLHRRDALDRLHPRRPRRGPAGAGARRVSRVDRPQPRAAARVPPRDPRLDARRHVDRTARPRPRASTHRGATSRPSGTCVHRLPADRARARSRRA